MDCEICGRYHGYNLDFSAAPGRGYGSGYKDGRRGVYRPQSELSAIRGYDAGHCAGTADKAAADAGCEVPC